MNPHASCAPRWADAPTLRERTVSRETVRSLVLRDAGTRVVFTLRACRLLACVADDAYMRGGSRAGRCFT